MTAGFIMIQIVLRDPAWRTGSPRPTGAACPPCSTHVNLYGRFDADMDTHLDLDHSGAA